MALSVAAPSGRSQQTAQPTTQFAEGVPKLQTADDTNARITELARSAAVRPGDYVIGSGDLLDIEVFEVPELSREIRVNQSGYIALPLIPTKIRVKGLTAFQLQDKLAELLQTNGLVTNPQVSVNVKEEHGEPITVIGAVKNPMVIEAVRSTTLLEVLSSAGGIADDAGNVVLVTRNGSPAAAPADSNNGGGAEAAAPQTFTINLDDLLNTGDSRFNIPVQGGDVVSVPRAGIIYVVGAVARPGGFVMANDHQEVTALKLLALAGGTTSTARSTQAVILRNNAVTGQKEQLPVDLKKVLDLKGPDVALLPNDILFVPDSASKRAWHKTGDIMVSLGSGVALYRLAGI
ncbi:MAG: polysaccharide biosynthesis/export family protein [Candidatus Acidiferrales bacterium]